MRAVTTNVDVDGDIHHYWRRYEIALKLLRQSSISKRNKELIEKFCNDCLSQGITPGRVQKYAYILRKIAEWLKKDFDKVTEEDLKKIVAMINRLPFTD